MTPTRIPLAFLAVFIGGGVGSCLRFLFNRLFDPLLATFVGGTLAANLVGGYLAGIVAGFFLLNGHLAPEWRLLVMTGFLGGLTTFSAFSVEMVTLLQTGRTGAALAGITLHVAGSLLLTMLGILTVRSLAAA